MLSRIEPSAIMRLHAYDGTWSLVVPNNGAQGSWFRQLVDDLQTHLFALARWVAFALLATCALGLAGVFIRCYYCPSSEQGGAGPRATDGLLDAEKDSIRDHGLSDGESDEEAELMTGGDLD